MNELKLSDLKRGEWLLPEAMGPLLVTGVGYGAYFAIDDHADKEKSFWSLDRTTKLINADGTTSRGVRCLTYWHCHRCDQPSLSMMVCSECGGSKAEQGASRQRGERQYEIYWKKGQGYGYYRYLTYGPLAQMATGCAALANSQENFIAWEYVDGYRSRISPTAYRAKTSGAYTYGLYKKNHPPNELYEEVRATAVILREVAP